MLVGFLSPNNLSKKMMRVIFSIYLAVACLVTSMQFLTEYLKTKDSILNELKQLEATVNDAITTSLWQYNHKQLNALIAGLLKMPIITGVDVLDKHANTMISERLYSSASPPLSIFHTKSELYWTLKEKELFLGSLTLYSSSSVILNRIWFGFLLIAMTAIIKLSVLFWLFLWAFDRYMASPLKELMLQINQVQLNQDLSKRIKLSRLENNELNQLQEYLNNMLAAMESDRKRLLESEQAKRNWLENAVAKRTEELQISNDKLTELASKDSLTGTLTRRSFFESAQQLLALSHRHNTPASFILMDLDHFKKINDTYGHFAGDQILIHFAQTIQDLLRKSDLIGRFGGEEFAIFLPDTGIEDAAKIADKIRYSISHSALTVEGKEVHYTVSLGVVSSQESDKLVDELFKRADLKLYGAKDKGRDRVEK